MDSVDAVAPSSGEAFAPVVFTAGFNSIGLAPGRYGTHIVVRPVDDIDSSGITFESGWSVGDAVAYMASLPLDANVLFMTVMASKMPFVGRG